MYVALSHQYTTLIPLILNRKGQWSPQVNDDSEILVPYQKDIDRYDGIPANEINHTE